MHYTEIVSLHALGYDFGKTGIVPGVLGQEHHTHPVTSLLRHGNAVEQYEFMRNLHHDASSVTSLEITSLCATVGHVLQHRKTFLDNVMVLAAVNVHHKSDPACIVFVFRRIKAFCLFVVQFVHCYDIRF